VETLFLENYAELMRKTGRETEAEKIEEGAKAIREQRPKQNPTGMKSGPLLRTPPDILREASSHSD